MGIACVSTAADPAWWAARGVTTTAAPSNLSPATIGQAKHMASMALAELQTQLSPQDYQSLYDEVAAIVSLAVPQTPTEFENQRQVLLTGQLKALAKPFYDKLRLLDAAWLDNEMDFANTRVVEPGSNPIAHSHGRSSLLTIKTWLWRRSANSKPYFRCAWPRWWTPTATACRTPGKCNIDNGKVTMR